jgi:hypothetical protein
MDRRISLEMAFRATDGAHEIDGNQWSAGLEPLEGMIDVV